MNKMWWKSPQKSKERATKTTKQWQKLNISNTKVTIKGTKSKLKKAIMLQKHNKNYKKVTKMPKMQQNNVKKKAKKIYFHNVSFISAWTTNKSQDPPGKTTNRKKQGFFGSRFWWHFFSVAPKRGLRFCTGIV